MHPTPLKSILALDSGGIAGAMLGSILPRFNGGAGRWPLTILLVAAIARFGVTAAPQTSLVVGGDEILRASLINIGLTIFAAACATSVLLRLRRT